MTWEASVSSKTFSILRSFLSGSLKKQFIYIRTFLAVKAGVTDLDLIVFPKIQSSPPIQSGVGSLILSKSPNVANIR